MLSRVADAVFWMNRYVERAENMARFVDVCQSLSLGGSAQWAPLVYASGDEELFQKSYGQFTGENVLKFLLFDDESPNSILSCLIKARENARTIREILSVSLWESINRFYLYLRESARNTDAIIHNPADFLERVKRYSHEVIGVTEATMSHGEAWNFGKIGRLLERADKTSRILDVKYFVLLPDTRGVGSATDVVQWSALLESTSALHMYRKKYGRIVPTQVAEFLILDPDFPRSMLFCVKSICRSIEYIGRPQPPSGNFPQFSDPDRAEGQSAATAAHELLRRLNDSHIGDIVRFGVHEFIDEFQRQLNGIGWNIHREIFDAHQHSLSQNQQ